MARKRPVKKQRSRKDRPPPIPREPCRVPGCGRPTSERKPYCIEHLDRLDYAAQLSYNLLQMEQEQLAATRKPKAIDLNGQTTIEILLCLIQQGPQTKERLNINLHLISGSIDGYLKRLKRAKLVVVTESARDREIVHITTKGRTVALAASAKSH